MRDRLPIRGKGKGTPVLDLRFHRRLYPHQCELPDLAAHLRLRLRCWPRNRHRWPALGKIATALSEGDSDGTLEYFDSQMKGYADLEQKIVALTEQADVSCAIDVVTDTEEEWRS